MRARTRLRIAAGLACAALASGCSEERGAATPAPRAERPLPPLPDGPAGLIPAFPRLPDFEFPVAMHQAPGEPGRWYLLEQVGRVRSFRDDPEASEASVALDLTGRVIGPRQTWDAGLLGLAFHPDFASNRRLFLFYVTPSAVDPAGARTLLAEFRMAEGGSRIDPASERVLLELEADFPSYKGGSLEFGPDGALYVSVGQNVTSETRPHPSRDTARLEGKILRLDVDAGVPYAIPPDNPFADGGGAPEVYAWGLRNSWKLSFDAPTGRLFAGEVGQHSFEEVNLIEAGRDYGWPLVEGDACDANCPPGYAAPIHAYAGPGVAIIGGSVYRGAAIDELRGVYLFADFMRAEVWGLHEAGKGWVARRLLRTGNELKGRGVVGSITSFATDSDGEIYVLTRGGRIARLVTRREAVRYYAGGG